MIDEKFLLLIPVLSLIGSGRYVYQVLKGRARPNRVTWLLWTVAPMIAFAAELQQGIGLASIQTFMAGFSPFLILVASFIGRRAKWQVSRFDVVCGALSVAGIMLWLITGEGNVAIICSIVADLLAGLPTVVKAWYFPETESYLVSVFGMVNALLTLLTIKQWTIAHAGFPIYIFAICAVIFVFVRFRPGKPQTALVV